MKLYEYIYNIYIYTQNIYLYILSLYKTPDSPKPRKLRPSDGSRLLVEFKEWSGGVRVIVVVPSGLPSESKAFHGGFPINNKGFSIVLS
jgi:hypothetical protein